MLYRWAVLLELLVNKFEWIKRYFQIKNYNEESDEESVLKDNMQYPEKLPEFQNDLPFLSKRMKSQRASQPAHIVPRTSSYRPNLVKTSRTIIGPK